jgi:hypothetical protein
MSKLQFTQGHLSKMMDKIDASLTEIRQINEKLKAVYVDNNGPGSEWVSQAEALKILNISRQMLVNYRKRGIIPYSKFGRKIYFKKSDINAHLNRHYKGPDSGPNSAA